MPEAVDVVRRRWPGKKLLRLFLVVVIGLPLAVLCGVNGWLASGWGRAWVAGKISSRAGCLPVRVAGASVTPWSGVLVKGLVIEQPEPLRKLYHCPLVEIAQVRAAPAWRAWLRGRLEVHSMDLDAPRLVVPLELLAHLGVVPEPPVPAPVTPPLAVTPPPPGEATPPGAAPPDAQPVPAPAKPAPAPQSPAGETGWIRIHGASLVIAAGGKLDMPLLALAGVDAELPVAGAAADAALRIAEMNVAGALAIKPPEIRVHWQEGELQFEESSWDIAGWHVLCAGRCAMRPGVPFVFQAILPKQPGADPAKCPWRGTKVGEGMAAARLTGFAQAPSTWQGDFAADIHNISLPLRDGHTVPFDACGMLLSLRGGVMTCRDAHAVGDMLSMLGNAMVLGDGRAAAVLRVVMPPGAARAMAERTAAAQPGVLWGFAPLGAPDRVFADVTLAGNPQEIHVALGEGGSVLPLARAVDLYHVLHE